MKYSVQLRMNGASGTQFLIDTWECADFNVALAKATKVAEALEEGHYVEIVREDNEVVASLN